MLSLQALTKENWLACAKLQVLPEHESFVAPNVFSIAESKFEPHYHPRVIYWNDQVIGFLMYCPEIDPPEPDVFWFFRFMLQPEFQNRGLGHQACQLAMQAMKALGAVRIKTMHHPDNHVAAHLYRQIGFKENGLREDGDMELEYHF